ncbi:MAG: hypothetical protein E7302_02370 [Butyrivibrio sp.]|nr:hypothetical protein [Butyrivibrio sp.]
MRKRCLVLGILGMVMMSACSSPSKTNDQAQSVDSSQIAEDEQATTDSKEAVDSTSETKETNTEEASTVENTDQTATTEDYSDLENSNETSRSVTTEQGDVEPLIAKVLEGTGVDVLDIKDSVIADFDGDGSREGFVFIGGDIDEEWSTCLGQLYFVSDNGKEMLKDTNFVVNDGKIIQEFPVSDKTFIAVEEAYTTSSVSFLYYVENGECKDSYLSGIGGFYKPDFVDDYAISLSCYDMSFDYEEGKEDEGMYMGHTWKPYYFYYDEATGRFEEYVGKEISEEELNAACGFDLAGEIKAAGNQIDGILRRDNGIINVNYSYKTEYEGGSVSIQYSNVTFNEKTKEFVNVWGDGENTWENSNFGGTYLTAISIQ